MFFSVEDPATLAGWLASSPAERGKEEGRWSEKKEGGRRKKEEKGEGRMM